MSAEGRQKGKRNELLWDWEGERVSERDDDDDLPCLTYAQYVHECIARRVLSMDLLFLQLSFPYQNF